MNKLRWGKFYWSDWADDPALALCSLAAQGLWMRLLCIAAQGTPYGHVTINGKPATTVQLAQLVPNRDDEGDTRRHRHRVRDMSRLIAQLERNGVAHRAPCGCLISRRMVRDGEIAKVRRDAVNARPDRAHPAPNPRPTRAHGAPTETGQLFEKQQNRDGFVNAESTEAESQKESPPYGPPQAGDRRGRARMNGGGRKPSRNAMIDIIREEMEEEARHVEASARQTGATVVPIARRFVRRDDDA